MKLASPGRSRDLVLTVAAMLVSLLLLALPFDGLVKGLLLLPAVLYLPGYALSAALFPPGTLSLGERLVYSIALSVGAAVLAGLLWQFAFVLNRTSWALLLAAVTLAGCAIAQRRRTLVRELQRARRSSDGASPWPRLDLPTAATVLVGFAAAVVAVVIAVNGLQEQRAESHFSALWVVPQAPASEAVEIGVLNHQGAPHTYRVELRAAGRTVDLWHGRLASRANKRVLLAPGAVPAGRELVVSLFRDGALYRRVTMQTGLGT